MESNNILVAPQLTDAEALYKIWHRTYDGTHDAFYRFITTPSPERDSFFRDNNATVEFTGMLLTTTIKNA